MQQEDMYNSSRQEQSRQEQSIDTYNGIPIKELYGVWKETEDVKNKKKDARRDSPYTKYYMLI